MKEVDNRLVGAYLTTDGIDIVVDANTLKIVSAIDSAAEVIFVKIILICDGQEINRCFGLRLPENWNDEVSMNFHIFSEQLKNMDLASISEINLYNAIGVYGNDMLYPDKIIY